MLPTEDTSQINRRYDGFRNTPFLWSELLEGLKMYRANELPNSDYPKIDTKAHIRLGKLIEQFVLFDMEQDAIIQLLQSNVQVFQDQITIGELDCLIKRLEVFMHIEIVYKFYLYDPSVSSEIERWVGPNRKDSLVLKLNKLKEKQMPLLYHPETSKILNELNIDPTEVQQRVFFKAQLFVPLESLESGFELVNNDCVKGFYICLKELIQFPNYTYYIPAKLDWLVEPHVEVIWLQEAAFQTAVSGFLDAHKSPLCWMKSPEGKIQKFFIVWWK